MDEKDMIQIKDSITMPADMSDALLKSTKPPHKKHSPYSRYPKIYAMLTAAILLTLAGFTSHASYNLYQEKHLLVFLESGLAQTETEQIGHQLQQISGITSCHFTSGEEAWENFQAEYLTPELAAKFPENPLADCSNYDITVSLRVNTQTIRDQIMKIEGVRHINNLAEQEDYERGLYEEK